MKKLVRNKATGAFLTGNGDWTQNLSKARVCIDYWEARTLQQQFKLRDVEVYYSEGNESLSEGDFSLPLA